ncbi:hypothetical protein TRSC58_07227 [Trypanosoma rangeli SC58]|uniref:Uncharacterized protein n=1 Tax=Trypanosoma rangeli SC58 TaxID=429131 RepID=A0A061IS62_TRYRA|nr:hypothetical protein TRSC58_07227 [Trypanosoma rangeli SC58]
MQGLTRPRSGGVLSMDLAHMLEAAAVAYTFASEDCHASTAAAALFPAVGNFSPEPCDGFGRLGGSWTYRHRQISLAVPTPLVFVCGSGQGRRAGVHVAPAKERRSAQERVLSANDGGTTETFSVFAAGLAGARGRPPNRSTAVTMATTNTDGV